MFFLTANRLREEEDCEHEPAIESYGPPTPRLRFNKMNQTRKVTPYFPIKSRHFPDTLKAWSSIP